MLVTLALAASLVLPNVHARDLTGTSHETRNLLGTPIVYVFGFTHEQKQEALEWREALAAEAGPELRVIEMPVLSGMAVLMRPVIENAMTRKTPEAVRPDIMTTTDRDALVAGFQISDPDAGSVVALADEEGAIRFVGRGGPTPEATADLLEQWRRLKPQP